jgi:hypothetical protein
MDSYDPCVDYDDCPKCGEPAEYHTCSKCGGEGFVEYDECPELWGEDCPSEINHLETCPECGGNNGWWWCPKCGSDLLPDEV